MNEEEKKNEPVVYRGDQITSPINKSNPKQGDPCHTLADDDRNYVVYENHRQDARFKPVGESLRRHRRIPAGIPETGMQASLGVGDRGVPDSRH